MTENKHDGGFSDACRQVEQLSRQVRSAGDEVSAMAAINAWAASKSGASATDDMAHFAMSIQEIAGVFAEFAANKPKKKLVVVIHGIRDHGVWLDMIKARLESACVAVQPLSFGRFAAIRFLLHWGVSSVVHEIANKIRVAQRRCPDHELTIISHSFGTYVAVNILRDFDDIECKNLVFCGAVVSSRFPFAKITRNTVFINDCGERDIWPVLAEGFGVGRYYGATGVMGIHETGVIDRFHDTHHAGFLAPEFVDEFWKTLVESDEVKSSPYSSARLEIPWGVSFLQDGFFWLRFFVYGICFPALALMLLPWGVWSFFLYATLLGVLLTFLGVGAIVASGLRRYGKHES